MGEPFTFPSPDYESSNCPTSSPAPSMSSLFILNSCVMVLIVLLNFISLMTKGVELVFMCSFARITLCTLRWSSCLYLSFCSRKLPEQKMPIQGLTVLATWQHGRMKMTVVPATPSMLMLFALFILISIKVYLDPGSIVIYLWHCLSWVIRMR